MAGKAFSAATYQNEWSIATARSKSACNFGSHDVGKLTLPSLPVWESLSCAVPGAA